MNKSTITRLNNKYDISIDQSTITNFSGNWLKMQFDIYLTPHPSSPRMNRWTSVSVRTNEAIYQSIERVLEKSN